MRRPKSEQTSFEETVERYHRRWAIVALLLAVPFALLACGDAGAGSEARLGAEGTRASAEPAPPVAWFEFERDRHDFGSVYAGSVHRASFELVAAGDEPLVVAEIEHSCNCTGSELSVVDDAGGRKPVVMGEPYSPGTRFVLDVVLNTKGIAGKQAQYARVVQQGNPKLILFHLDAVVEPFLVVEPAHLELRGVTTLAGGEGVAQVRSAGGERMKLDCMRARLPANVEVVFEPVGADAEGRSDRWTMRFLPQPGVARGPLKHKLLFVTDVRNEHAEPDADGELPLHGAELWVRGDVKGVMNTRPERLSFGRMRSGKKTTRKVVLRSNDPDFRMSDVAVGLFSVRSGDEPFAHADRCVVRGRALDDGHGWETEIQIGDLPEPGPFRGLLVLKVEHPLEPVVVVPFEGTFLE